MSMVTVGMLADGWLHGIHIDRTDNRVTGKYCIGVKGNRKYIDTAPIEVYISKGFIIDII